MQVYGVNILHNLLYSLIRTGAFVLLLPVKTYHVGLFYNHVTVEHSRETSSDSSYKNQDTCCIC